MTILYVLIGLDLFWNIAYLAVFGYVLPQSIFDVLKTIKVPKNNIMWISPPKLCGFQLKFAALKSIETFSM